MADELIKEWLKNLIDEEIETEKGTISNERIWGNGASNDAEVSMHQSNIENHEQYIKVLEEIKANYCK